MYAEASKAVTYLTLVAQRAAANFAHTEAITTVDDALVHAERLPTPERDQHVADLLTRQMESFFYSGQRQEAFDRHRNRQERLQQLQSKAPGGRYYVWLGAHYSFLGKREQAVQSARQAIQDAQQHQDDIIMGIAYGWLGVEDFFAGRAEAVADTIGDRRLLTNAVQIRGWALATRGDIGPGMAACRQALELSPGAYETAMIVMCLGFAHLEHGNVDAAIPLLEQAVEQGDRYRSQQVQSRCRSYLAEAYRAQGWLEQAHDMVQQALKRATDIKPPWGIGLVQRRLGRIAQACGEITEAETALQQARETLAAIQNRFELACTHLDLASVAHTQGNPETAGTHLSTAYTWFKTLQIPRYVERTEQLARGHGVTLKAIELETLPEASS